MAKKFDLGDALADVLKVSDSDTETLEHIDINLIDGDDRNFYSVDGVEDLAANIQLVGLQQPIRIRLNPDMPGRYLIVSGHRRRAALWTLYEEDPEKWGKVPCIIEHDSVSPAMQELRLIYANADTRKMSSADISRQAERVEMLLYELKEEGVEFPGRMRDHVAEACKVSATKLATLKVIRENLAQPIKALWEKGSLKESPAYAFAQNDPDVQMLVFAQLKASMYNSDPRHWFEHEVKGWADRIKKERKLKCAHGHCDKCDNLENRLSRMANSHWDDYCREGKCCYGCPNLAICKSACPHLTDEISAAKAKRKEQKAEEKARQVERDRPDVEQITELWIRFAEARAIAGKSMEEYIKAADIYTDEATKKRWPEQEKGKKITRDSGLPYSGGHGTSLWDIRRLRKAADALGCSLDYLLCRTDDPRKVRDIKKEVQAWHSRGETPPMGKAIITYALNNDGPKYTPAVWDGSHFHAPGKPDKELTGLAQQFTKWTLLPEDA